MKKAIKRIKNFYYMFISCIIIATISIASFLVYDFSNQYFQKYTKMSIQDLIAVSKKISALDGILKSSYNDEDRDKFFDSVSNSLFLKKGVLNSNLLDKLFAISQKSNDDNNLLLYFFINLLNNDTFDINKINNYNQDNLDFLNIEISENELAIFINDILKYFSKNIGGTNPNTNVDLSYYMSVAIDKFSVIKTNIIKSDEELSNQSAFSVVFQFDILGYIKKIFKEKIHIDIDSNNKLKAFFEKALPNHIYFSYKSNIMPQTDINYRANIIGLEQKETTMLYNAISNIFAYFGHKIDIVNILDELTQKFSNNICKVLSPSIQKVEDKKIVVRVFNIICDSINEYNKSNICESNVINLLKCISKPFVLNPYQKTNYNYNYNPFTNWYKKKNDLNEYYFEEPPASDAFFEINYKTLSTNELEKWLLLKKGITFGDILNCTDFGDLFANCIDQDKLKDVKIINNTIDGYAVLDGRMLASLMQDVINSKEGETPSILLKQVSLLFDKITNTHKILFSVCVDAHRATRDIKYYVNALNKIYITYIFELDKIDKNSNGEIFINGLDRIESNAALDTLDEIFGDISIKKVIEDTTTQFDEFFLKIQSMLSTKYLNDEITFRIKIPNIIKLLVAAGVLP